MTSTVSPWESSRKELWLNTLVALFENQFLLPLLHHVVSFSCSLWDLVQLHSFCGLGFFLP